MPMFLGIDAGGTKTECAVADASTILGRATAGSCKLLKVGRERAARELAAAVHQALADAGCEMQDIASCCVGLAGASHPEVFAWTRKTMETLLDAPCVIVGDNLIALEAAFQGGAGIIVVSGTGSIAFGRNADGVTARAGGWGPTISDEGSGHWIGRMAASRAMRAWDAGRNSVLVDKLMASWRVRTREEMVALVNASPSPEFADLVPRVAEAAANGDASALQIMKDAGAELAELALSVLWRLWRDASGVNLCVAGGVLQNREPVRNALRESLAAKQKGLIWDERPVDPVSGAIFLAKKMMNG